MQASKMFAIIVTQKVSIALVKLAIDMLKNG